MAKREQTFQRAARKRKAVQRAKRVAREQAEEPKTTESAPAKSAPKKSS